MANHHAESKRRKLLWLLALLAVLGLVLLAASRGPAATLLNRKALKDMKAGRYAEAGAKLRMAVRLDAGGAEHRISLGTAYFHQGRLVDALHEFDQAQMLRPNSYDVLIARARCLSAMRRYEEAFVSYQGASSLEANRMEPIEALADLSIRLERYESSLEWIAKEVCPEPGAQICEGQAMNELGRRLAAAGKDELALSWFFEAANASPDDPDPLYDAGFLLNALERFEEAQPVLEEAIRRAPLDFAAMCELAWTRDRLEDPAGAEELYASALRSVPGHPSCLWGYAVYLERHGRTSQAAETLGQLIEGSQATEESRQKASRLRAELLDSPAP